MSYYADKVASLADLFGCPVSLEVGGLRVGGAVYPVIDDVIVLLPPGKRPARLRSAGAEAPDPAVFSSDIQATFGDEWTTYRGMMAEHREEFEAYFDLIDLDALKGSRVLDLGCGMGRWATFVAPQCREIVLVDFSEAIFVARENLRAAPNAIFLMGDVRDLPIRDDAADLAYCLGVLHHLPTPALDEVRRLRRLAPRLLVYLYYALENRPWHYRALLGVVTRARERLCRVRNARARAAWTWSIAVFIYKPLVGLGHAMRPFGLARHVPLHEGYRGKSLARVKQDVYDRFFTGIEQRVTRDEILSLGDVFRRIEISPTMPFWHALLFR